MKVQGTIESYNHSEGKMPGVKVGGKWYNASPKTEGYVKAFREKKGAAVELTVSEQGVIEFITPVGGGSAPANDHDEPAPNSTEQPISGKIAGVTIGMALNNAAAYVQAKHDELLPPQKWAQKVVEYADALLEEMLQHDMR